MTGVSRLGEFQYHQFAAGLQHPYHLPQPLLQVLEIAHAECYCYGVVVNWSEKGRASLSPDWREIRPSNCSVCQFLTADFQHSR